MKQIYYSIRMLVRGRGSNSIKLVSLTLGLLIGLLLFSQIAYELSYENFYKDPDRVVLLCLKRLKNGKPTKTYDYDTFRPAATDLWEALPDLIESASASVSFWQPELYLGDEKVEDASVILADTLYFQTIGLEVLKGNPRDLSSMNNAFLSQSKAREMFGDEDPIGKEISVGKMFNVTVRGIYQDVPGNTKFPHNVMLSSAVADWGFGRSTWTGNDIYYVLFRLKRPQDVEAMNQRVQKAVERYTETRQGTSVMEFSVLPLRDIHISEPNTIRRLVILGVLGFSIFFVSIMNYVLAAISTISRRAKAVGVHKCNGAGSGDILGMFMLETGVMVLASVLCSLLLMYAFSDTIEDMLGARLVDLFTLQTLYVPVLTVLLLFLVAGVLPGQMYARIPVTQVFRRYTDGKRSWKRGLLFMQFAGVAFILGMLFTAIHQYHDLMNRNVGFHTDRLVVGSISGKLEDFSNITDAIRRQPYVESVACSTSQLLQHYSTSLLKDTQGTPIASIHFMSIDKDFPAVSGMKLLQGTWPRHEGEALIGRKTMETLKWDTDAIGKKLSIPPGWADLEDSPTVVGVIEDIRNMGFFNGQTNTAFILSGRLRAFNVRLKEPVDENLKRLNVFAKETWPDKALEFTSYNEIRRIHNESVYRFRNIVYVTSICILLIVLMGLIGYVNDETQRRSKEIAIRKVNGAEASSILRLLSVGILKVAVGAVAIGIVFSWYVSDSWIEQFSDSALLSPLWFVLLALCLLALIVLVVIVKAWRIANENPVNSIKSE